jgi:hypothetical protein
VRHQEAGGAQCETHNALQSTEALCCWQTGRMKRRERPRENLDRIGSKGVGGGDLQNLGLNLPEPLPVPGSAPLNSRALSSLALVLSSDDQKK